MQQGVVFTTAQESTPAYATRGIKCQVFDKIGFNKHNWGLEIHFHR